MYALSSACRPVWVLHLDPGLRVEYSRHMDIKTATSALGALSQESRLEVFRLLIRQGIQGLAAGEIARTLDIPHNTMSSHLAIMANAGLVKSRRDGRSVIYSIDFDGTRELLAYLMEECCQGRPEVCSPLLDNVLAGTCSARDKADEGRRLRRSPAGTNNGNR